MTDMTTTDPESAFPEIIAEYEPLPFPRVVATGVFNLDLLRDAWSEFDKVHSGWHKFRNHDEFKDGCRFEHAVPGGSVEKVREVLESPEWIACLEDWFGIDGLQPDGLGGGMHSIPEGGHLGMHVDFNRHDDGRYRRINCLVYLNDNPDETGDLILMDDYDEHPTDLVRIPAEIGTVVAFETSDHSWHGHPYRYRGKTPRRSIAMYYFTDEPPSEVGEPHSTIFTGTPAESPS